MSLARPSSVPVGVARVHGGTDARGPARFDFSTNSNACGPCPLALQAVQAADATRYPDSAYTTVRAQLADWHGVEAWRIVLAGSASEAIFRLTALARQRRAHRVWLPSPAYGDYGHAAQAWGLEVTTEPAQADLLWGCEPASPTGQTALAWAAMPPETLPALACGWAVLDRAYAPMRLAGRSLLSPQALDGVWQLWSPNKTLGLTGVRAAYAIAPAQAHERAMAMDALAPSWPLGAHGVALLTAWTTPAVQAWVQRSLPILADYKAAVAQGLRLRGWQCQPSDTHYFCARPPQAVAPEHLAALRQQGIQLRDTTSMGLPGWFRLSAQPADACQALLQALDGLNATKESA